MASMVPSFSIASSPQGAIGGVSGSPQKSGRNGRKGPSASELLDQIKHLEAEGQKLRTDNAPAFGPLVNSGGDGLDLGLTANQEKPELPKFTSTSPSSLSALVDISSEQKTISDLRLQLEQQKQETDRLHSHLLGDGISTSMSGAGAVLRIPNSPSRTGFSTLPSTELFSSRRPTASASAPSGIEISPPSHLEKALKDSQEQVADLRRRLLEANEQSEEQKKQFRQNVEELKAKLHETMAGRESLLDLRQKEVAHQEEKIGRLQGNIQQLQEKLKAQELALADATHKADGYSRESYVTETTLNQVRLILADAERRRGRPYFDSEPASNQGAPMLVHTLERCLQEMTKDLEVKHAKLEEYEAEIRELRHNVSTDQHNLSQEHHQKITQMTLEHEKQMIQANERSSNARKQATHLQSQLSLIQGQHEQQMKLKEEVVKDLESKVKHLREELQEEQIKWQGKREAYEVSMADTEKEIAKMRSERDEAIRNHAATDSRVADLQLTINKQQREIEVEKDKSTKFWEREGQLRSRTSELETRLGEKERDVDRLERMLSSVKQECNATVSEKVSSIERQERERHLEKIGSLTAQLSEVSEKCNKTSLELETGRMETRDMKQQVRELTERSDTLKVQYDAAVAEKKHLADMLSAKTSDFDRVSQERDYYFNIMEQKNTDLSQLKTQKERLTVQLEEKEKNIDILQQQSSNFSQMVEANSRASDNIREERDVYAKQLQETTVALEELKNSRDATSKKLKLREKQVRHLETEKQKVGEELELRSQELGILQQEKDTLFKELKESRYEVVSLSEEKDVVKKELEGRKHQMEKTVGKLQYRLKNAEHDLSLTQKALHKRESTDNHAVKVADKMQKEVTAKRSLVDTLQSKVRWYEDQIDTLVKAKTSLEGDKEKLKSSLNKTLLQNQHLAAELEVANSRSTELKQEINKLETSLEKYASIKKVLRKVDADKAMVRTAASQAQIERFEQEMTRLKLSHQLDVKEAVQKASAKSQAYSNPAVPAGDHPPSGQREAQAQNHPAQYNPPQPPQAQYQISQASQYQHQYQSQPAAQYQSQQAAQPLSHYQSDAAPQPVRSTNPDFRVQQQATQPPGSQSSYKDIGSELKGLLKEMRTLITDKQESANSLRQKTQQKPKYRPQHKPRTALPSRQTDRYFHPMSDVSYHSDAEIDDESSRHRARTLTGNYYGANKTKDTRSHSPTLRPNHRRSRSAEASFLAPKEVSYVSVSDQPTNDFSRDIQLTDVSESDHVTPSPFGPGNYSSFLSQDSVPFYSQSSPGIESEKDIPVRASQPATDTHALCQRLEQKIVSLTKIGGSLQKENKEMADLMKIQGRKLKKVKESEKQIRKGTR